jgi:hypothetical protein
MYNPSLGVWLTRDKAPSPDSNNLYEFVKDNPPNMVDPTGLSATTAVAPLMITTNGSHPADIQVYPAPQIEPLPTIPQVGRAEPKDLYFLELPDGDLNQSNMLDLFRAWIKGSLPTEFTQTSGPVVDSMRESKGVVAARSSILDYASSNFGRDPSTINVQFGQYDWRKQIVSGGPVFFLVTPRREPEEWEDLNRHAVASFDLLVKIQRAHEQSADGVGLGRDTVTVDYQIDNRWSMTSFLGIIQVMSMGYIDPAKFGLDRSSGPGETMYQHIKWTEKYAIEPSVLGMPPGSVQDRPVTPEGFTWPPQNTAPVLPTKTELPELVPLQMNLLKFPRLP